MLKNFIYCVQQAEEDRISFPTEESGIIQLEVDAI